MTVRVHFTDHAIEKLRDFVPSNDTFKPHGLWYSVEGNGDGWSDWCKAENFKDTNAQVQHELAVVLDSILVLSSPIDILAFTEQYARCVPTSDRRYGIEWAHVAQNHAGIEIAPYQWSLRLSMETPWYYSWDCASGCIWQPTTCVKIVRTRKEVNPIAPDLPV